MLKISFEKTMASGCVHVSYVVCIVVLFGKPSFFILIITNLVSSRPFIEIRHVCLHWIFKDIMYMYVSVSLRRGHTCKNAKLHKLRKFSLLICTMYLRQNLIARGCHSNM